MMLIKKNDSVVWLCHYGTMADLFAERLDWMISSGKTVRFENP